MVLPESNNADTETEPIDTGKYTSLPCTKESAPFCSSSLCEPKTDAAFIPGVVRFLVQDCDATSLR